MADRIGIIKDGECADRRISGGATDAGRTTGTITGGRLPVADGDAASGRGRACTMSKPGSIPWLMAHELRLFWRRGKMRPKSGLILIGLILGGWLLLSFFLFQKIGPLIAAAFLERAGRWAGAGGDRRDGRVHRIGDDLWRDPRSRETRSIHATISTSCCRRRCRRGACWWCDRRRSRLARYRSMRGCWDRR